MKESINFEFSIFKCNTQLLKYMNLIAPYIIVIIILIVFYFTKKFIGTFIFIGVFLMILSIYIRTKYIKYENIGKIIFNNYNIITPNNIIKYNNIKKIYLSFSSIKGERYPRYSRYPLFCSPGWNNTILIKTNNKKIKVNILIQDQDDYIQFKLLYNFFKQKGIKVKTKGFTENIDKQFNGKY